MIVAGHHVLGAQVDEGQDQRAAAFLDIALVAFCDIVGPGLGSGSEEYQQNSQQREQARQCLGRKFLRQLHHLFLRLQGGTACGIAPRGRPDRLQPAV